MGYNIGPKIGIDGEAEFRKQIRDINAEYKALEAETKALTAAFEANGDEQGKLEGTSKVLEKQISSQKNKIDLLEDALQKATAKYGENSVEATRLRGALYDTQATLTGLESELQDTNRRLEETANGMEEFQEEAEGAGDAALDFSDILGANFIADAAKDALDEVIDAVVEFAKEMPEAASEVNAANSQFEQTFKELEGTARSALQSISDETGIAASRMQENYTQLYAFTKSVGGDSAEALDIASRAMIAAADNAAYYDKSIEEATEQLQSFIKGNYENDSALGISATETARNTKANELYAKSFNELSEAQKVDVLLAMVEAGNKASGALGQAAREADSWTNVQGELDEAMRQFQATLGSPVLEAVIPVIQGITASIYDLIEVTASEVLVTSMENATLAWQNAEIQFAATSQEIETTALLADQYRLRLVDLEATGLTTIESQREYANIVARLNELYPNLNLQIDTQTGLLDENSRAQLDNLEAMKQKALYEAQEERYTELLRSHADATLAVKDAEQALVRVQTERDRIETQLTQTTGLSIEELIRLYNNQTSVNSALQTNSDILPDLAAALYALGTASGELTAEEMELIAQLISLNQEESNLNTEVEKGSAVVSEFDAKLEEMQGTLGDTAADLDGAAGSQDEMTAAVQETVTTLESLRQEYETARQTARDSIDSQIGYFDELSTESDRTAADIVANWESQKQAFDQYSANLQKAVDMGLDAALVQQLSDGSEQSMQILNALVTSTDTNVEEINAAFKKVSESRDTVSSTMADVQTEMSDKLTELAANVSESWGDMAGVVKDEIAEMQRYINSLTGKTVYVNVVTQKNTSNSSSSSEGPKNASVASINTPSAYSEDNYDLDDNVPYLADGAVISPNAPFLAILGDQQSGLNIEAPLSTIQEAVALVMRDIIDAQESGIEVVVTELQRILAAVLAVDINANEDVVAGAVLGVERNIANYEAAMADLGSSGYWAYLDERADLAESFPSIMDSLVMPTANLTAPAINYGGFEIHIYQQAGEDPEDLAYRFMDVLQQEFDRKGVSFNAYK